MAEFFLKRNKTEVRCFTCKTQWCYRMEKGHVREQNGCQLSEQGWNAWVTEKKKAMCSISKALICGVVWGTILRKPSETVTLNHTIAFYTKHADTGCAESMRHIRCWSLPTCSVLSFIMNIKEAFIPNAIRAPLLTNPVLLAWCTMILSMLPYHLKLDQMFRAQHNRLRTQTSLHKL